MLSFTTIEATSRGQGAFEMVTGLGPLKDFVPHHRILSPHAAEFPLAWLSSWQSLQLLVAWFCLSRLSSDPFEDVLVPLFLLGSFTSFTTMISRHICDRNFCSYKLTVTITSQIWYLQSLIVIPLKRFPPLFHSCQFWRWWWNSSCIGCRSNWRPWSNSWKYGRTSGSWWPWWSRWLCTWK